MKILGMSDFEQRINSIFNTIKLIHGTHADLMEKYRAIDSELHSITPKGRRRYSQYMCGYAFGYYMAQANALYNTMEFCYLVDGILYSTSKNTTRRRTVELYGTDKMPLLNNCTKGAYWPDVDKPFNTCR